MNNLVPVQAPALPELAVYLGRNTVPNKHTFKVIWGMKKITVARRCDGEGKRKRYRPAKGSFAGVWAGI